MNSYNANRVQNLGLINTLFTIVNNEPVDQPDTVLARYFLENYTNLSNLNIYDVADECFVSRSSIRRFCQRIGYENFKQLKNDFKQFSYEYHYFMNTSRKEDYRDNYMRELANVQKDFNELITDDKLREIAARIHDSDQVVLMSAYNSVNALIEFQRPLVISHKLVRVMNSENIDKDYLEALDENGLVIVVSPMGHFAEVMLDVISEMPAYCMLVTTSHKEEFQKVFDEIVYLSKDDHTDEKSVNGKIGNYVFFDFLYATYFRMYGDAPK